MIVRAAEDGQSLDIKDNHPPDASASPAVDTSQFAEEASSDDQNDVKFK